MIKIYKHLGMMLVICFALVNMLRIRAQTDLTDLLSEENCPSSCWIGIVPNVTTETEMANILDVSGIEYEKSPLGDTGTAFVYSITSGYIYPLVSQNAPAFAAIITNEGTVAAVDILLADVSVGDVILAYGAPKAVIDDDTISVDLAYPLAGIVFTIRETNPDYVFSVRIVTEETVNRAYVNSTYISGDYFPCSDSSQLCAVSTATPVPTLTSTPSVICALTISDTPALFSAITSANTSPEADTICLEAGTYTLTTSNNSASDGANGLPVITSDITLHGLGAGANILRDSAAPAFRILKVDTGARLVLENITISGGDAGSGNGGGMGSGAVD